MHSIDPTHSRGIRKNKHVSTKYSCSRVWGAGFSVCYRRHREVLLLYETTPPLTRNIRYVWTFSFHLNVAHIHEQTGIRRRKSQIVARSTTQAATVDAGTEPQNSSRTEKKFGRFAPTPRLLHLSTENLPRPPRPPGIE